MSSEPRSNSSRALSPSEVPSGSDEPEPPGELTGGHEDAQIESGELAAYVYEVARATNDSARAVVLNALNLDLPAVE